MDTGDSLFANVDLALVRFSYIFQSKAGQATFESDVLTHEDIRDFLGHCLSFCSLEA